MSNISIKVEGLGKLYRLGEVGTGTLAQDLKRWWAATRGKEDPFAKVGEVNDRTSKGNSDYVWALKNVSFEVKQGEVLGIIGRNGAGKSTLLKLLSKVTAPSIGRIKVNGRIASLLEVGTGFHPDLTGRENIFLNGAILGMSKAEIRSKFDEIVDFSGVERYIDTPVKRYSSGMYVRLAFAVAAFLEPEILIVDEVLAVGDIEFQKKCLGRMKDVSVNDGRTVLFVSHNLNSLSSLCDTGLLFQNGQLVSYTEINKAITEYESFDAIKSDNSAVWYNNIDELEAEDAIIEKISIIDSSDNMRNEFTTTEDIFIKYDIAFRKDINHVKVGFDILKEQNIVFRSEQVDTLAKTSFHKNEKISITCTIPSGLLNEGVYSIMPIFTIHCVRSLTKIKSPVVRLNIKMDTSISEYHAILNGSNHPGPIYPLLKWKL